MILLALYKLRALLDGSLRLRTACDLEVDHGRAGSSIQARRPEGFELPALGALGPAVKEAIGECRDQMVVTEVRFEDEFKKGKGEPKTAPGEDDEDDETEGKT